MHALIFQITKTLSTPRRIYTHPDDLSFYGVNDNFVKLDASGAHGMHYNVVITYEYTKCVSLPYPYKTNCVDYRARGKESRAHYYDSCVNEKSIETFGKIPKSILAGVDVNYQYLPDTVNFDATDGRFQKIEEACDKKSISDDCDSENYAIKLVESTLKERAFSYIGVVDIGMASIVVYTKAVIETIDYVTYVLSCLSFWFAFSPIVLLTEGTIFKSLSKRLTNFQNAQ